MVLSIGIAAIFLIIPGIVVAFMFSQTFFILAENNEKFISECLKESSVMMNGHKIELFVLGLSFLMWWIVASITFRIGTLYVYPYQQVTLVNYYLALKNK